MREFIEKAEEIFDVHLDTNRDTQIWLTGSDHGYEEYMIGSLWIRQDDCQGFLYVEDAGFPEYQWRLTLITFSDEPVLQWASFWNGELETG